MSVEFIRTLRTNNTGDDESGRWTSVRLCRLGNQCFRIDETVAWDFDSENARVDVFPCAPTGENLSPRHPVASLSSGSSDPFSTEEIVRALEGITEQQIADAISKARRAG